MKNDKTLRMCVYGMCIHDDKILMVRTQSGSKRIFNFPGGGVDDEETSAEALMRECREELGATVEVGDMFFVSGYHHDEFPDSVSLHVHYTIKIESPIDYQLHGAQWFALDNLPVNEMLSIDVEVTDKLQSTNS